jgi:predicted metal-binding protein
MPQSIKTNSLMQSSQLQGTDDVEKKLDKYCTLAIQLGASDAKIITSDQVIIERRVSAKCSIPKCASYGTCRNCPPYTPSAVEMKEIVSEYEYAIFVRIVLAPQELTSSSSTSHTKADPKKIFQLVSGVESRAFYDGYCLAMGLAGGSCRRALCNNAACNAIVPGESCRYPLKSRPSMESVGINAFKMAVNMGWDIYPMGKTTCPNDVPHGNRLGLIMLF